MPARSRYLTRGLDLLSLLGRRLGADIRRSSERRLVGHLAKLGIRSVLDVGAGTGNYAASLFRSGYRGRIISFEPLPRAWSCLARRAARHSLWDVAERCALTDRDGTALFHQAGNGVSSSLLLMTDTHVAAAPESATVASIAVKTRSVDSLLPTLGEGPFFLKLDVQGAEDLVLRGALDALASLVVGVQVEMSLTELYERQAMAGDLNDFLCARGFECWDIVPGFRSPRGRMLQYDGIYFKSSCA